MREAGGNSACVLPPKNVFPVTPAREWRDSLLPAEARIHFRSYKSAEFLFRGGKTRLLINKRGLNRDQVDKLRNLFKRADGRALYQSMRIFSVRAVSDALVVAKGGRNFALGLELLNFEDCPGLRRGYFQPSLRD